MAQVTALQHKKTLESSRDRVLYFLQVSAFVGPHFAFITASKSSSSELYAKKSLIVVLK